MSKVGTLVVTCIVASIGFVFLYAMQHTEPFLSNTTPFILDIVEFGKNQFESVKGMLGEYYGQILSLIGVSVAGVASVVKSWFNKQKDSILNEGEEKVRLVNEELTNAFNLNQTLQVENSKLKSRLDSLEGVEGTIAGLQTSLALKTEELKRATAERIQAERMYALEKNPSEEPELIT